MAKRPGELLGGEFPIGYDNMPVRGMRDARRRGANILVRWDLEGGIVKPSQWASAAAEFGFKTIRPPVNPIDDKADPTLIAVNLPDEPDLSSHWYAVRPAAGWPPNIKVFYTWTAPNGITYDLVGKEQGNPPVATGANLARSVEVYQGASAIVRQNWPDFPIFGNMAGNAVTSGMEETAYRGFMSAVDWGGSDWYPVDADTTPFPIPDGLIRRYGYDFPKRALQRLSGWSGGKPQFAYISIVNQRLGQIKPDKWRWPDIREIQAQTWAAIAGGAEGIIYFAMLQSPWRSDALTSTIKGDYTVTPAEQAAAKLVEDGVIAMSQQIQTLAPFLNRPQDRVENSSSFNTGFTSANWLYTGDDQRYIGASLSIFVNHLGVKNGALEPCEVQIKVAGVKPAPIPQPQPDSKPSIDPAAFQALSDRQDASQKRIEAIQAQLDQIKSRFGPFDK